MFKAELLKLYQSQGLSATQLRKLLNQRYYHDLKEYGYEKQSQFIPPNALRKFFELFGKPIETTEIYD